MQKEGKSSICNLSFTKREKIFAQSTFNAGVIVASYGLFLENKLLGIGYLLYLFFSFLLMMRYTICPRCPHLNIANDCVNLSPSIVKMIVSNRKGPFNNLEKILFILALYGVFIFPIYWIASDIIILVLFLLFFGGHLLGLHLHYCPNCQNKSCIQNSNKNLLY